MAIYISKKKGIPKPVLQEKEASATTIDVEVVPDEGYDALSKVTVNALNLQEKTADAGAVAINVTADEGYDALSKVTVNAINNQSKTIRATVENQTITPDEGYSGLQEVVVQPQNHTNPDALQISEPIRYDMGAVHNYRYIQPEGLIREPEGILLIETNGIYDPLTAMSVPKRYVEVDVHPVVNLQDKTATAGSSVVTVTADDGYDGLGEVRINAINNQSKSVTATSSTQYVYPSSGYSGLSSVTVNPQVHSGRVSGSEGVLQDLGQYHNVRYVDNTGLIQPYGTKTIEANGTHDVASYSKAYVNVPPQYIPLPETTLWTNSSPTSSFSAQSVTLSKAVQNFEYLEIYYRFSTSDSTTVRDIFLVEDLDTSSITRRIIGMRRTSGETRVRPIQLTSSTTIQFSASYQTTTSSQSTSNTYIIPTKIVGRGSGSIGDIDDDTSL